MKVLIFEYYFFFQNLNLMN